MAEENRHFYIVRMRQTVHGLNAILLSVGIHDPVVDGDGRFFTQFSFFWPSAAPDPLGAC
jgi:hypothetical protein